MDMTLKRMIGVAFGALILGLGAVFALASPAQAQAEHTATSPWQALDTDDGTDALFPGVWSPSLVPTASLASSVDVETATLVWAADGPNLGTSVETSDLGLAVDAGAVVSFHYELSDGATCSGGAPRVFMFVGGTQYNSVPITGVDCGIDGDVSFPIAEAGVIGYAGIVYDNGVPGTVVVSELKVDDTLILFGDRPEPDPDPTVDPSPSPSLGTDPGDESPAPGVGGSADGELPKTGRGWLLPGLAVGGAAVLAGFVVYRAARRQPIRFTA